MTPEELAAIKQRIRSGHPLRSDVRPLLARVEELEAALAFYADPETYHGVAFLFDPPGGGFREDIDLDHGHSDYDRAMPGARARRALGGAS